MILYLLKSMGCLALLLFFYHLILEKEKMHNFNRFYLLGSIVFSFLIPLFTITIDKVMEDSIVLNQSFKNQTILENTTPILLKETFDYNLLFIGFYILISFVFLIRFGRNLFKIIKKIKQNKLINYKNAVLVLVDDKILPHTFWNFIFINKYDYYTHKIEEELFTHELTHVTQKHTLDVLIIEFLQAIFWINPLFIFLKKAIQLNHEFLADESVIHQHKNTFQYQYLLLNKAAWNNEYYLASNLNYSLTKKRLEMMTTQSSITKIWLKKLAIIPVLIGFIFLFAERVEAQKVMETITEQVNSLNKKSNNLTDNEIYKEYFFRNGSITFKDKNGKEIRKKYSELTKEEKKKVVPPPPLKSNKKVPTQKLIRNLKDSSKYTIWIDGKVVKNDILANYKNTDFSNYLVSSVHNNAKSKRFPQKYQASLETTKYFEIQNKKRAKAFENYKKEYTLKEKATTSRGKSIKTGFKIIKGNRYYFVTVKNNTKYYNKDGKLADNSGKILSNKKAKASSIIPDNYITKTYFQGKVFCKFTDDKPYTRSKNSLKEIKNFYNVDKFNRLNKYYEKLRNEKPHYIKSLKKRKNEMDKEFSLLSSLYSKLSVEDKKKVKRPTYPYYPYLRLMKNNKVFYKLKSELTEEDTLLIPPPPPPPNASKEEIGKAKKAYKEWKKRTGNDYIIPPPPPPRNHLNQVIEMAKKGAKFYYEGKPINSDKAITLLKKNKKLNIHSESTNYSNYKVWISKTPIKN